MLGRNDGRPAAVPFYTSEVNTLDAAALKARKVIYRSIFAAYVRGHAAIPYLNQNRL
jgi:hypothetical protein